MKEAVYISVAVIVIMLAGYGVIAYKYFYPERMPAPQVQSISPEAPNEPMGKVAASTLENGQYLSTILSIHSNPEDVVITFKNASSSAPFQAPATKNTIINFTNKQNASLPELVTYLKSSSSTPFFIITIDGGNISKIEEKAK